MVYRTALVRKVLYTSTCYFPAATNYRLQIKIVCFFRLQNMHKFFPLMLFSERPRSSHSPKCFIKNLIFPIKKLLLNFYKTPHTHSTRYAQHIGIVTTYSNRCLFRIQIPFVRHNFCTILLSEARSSQCITGF